MIGDRRRDSRFPDDQLQRRISVADNHKGTPVTGVEPHTQDASVRLPQTAHPIP